MTNLAKSDYIFVKGNNIDAEHPYGDMDRLKTSFTGGTKGVIMPSRTGDDQRIISGEDLCYLAEGVGERTSFCRPDGYFVSRDYRFMRKFRPSSGSTVQFPYGGATPVDITRFLHEMAPYFLKTNPTDGTYSSSGYTFDRYSSSDLASSESDFTTGGEMQKQKIMNLFEDEKKLSIAICSANVNYDFENEVISRQSYVSEYPLTGGSENLSWYGGLEAQSELPAHRGGGISTWTVDIVMTCTPLLGIPDGMSVGQGEVWVDFSCSYYNVRTGGQATRESCYYLKKVGNFTQSGDTLSCTFSGSDFLALSHKISQERFGWTWGSMPDEYGRQYCSLHPSNIYFMVPVSHTKWWN